MPRLLPRVGHRLIVTALVVTVLAAGCSVSGLDQLDQRGAGLDQRGAGLDQPEAGLDPRKAALARLDLDALRGRTSAPGAREGASGYEAALAANVRALRVGRLDWRLVRLTGAATALADVTWRLPEDRRATTTRVQVTLGTGATAGSAGTVVAVAGAGERWPPWLAGPVAVARRPGVVVVAAHADLRVPRYARLAEQALAAVRQVVPARRPLVVEVLADPAAMVDTLAGQEGEYDGLAAVTTTADATRDPAAPVRVVVDDQLLAPLDARARQVVLTHETVHAETGGAVARMPLWLLEGFADQVALRPVRLPVQRLAAHAIAAVRAHGVPDALPTDAAFGGPDAEVAYEQAWLACRLLARQGGQDALVRLYRAVRGGTPVAAALREVFGTSQPDLVRTWRHRLARWSA